MFDFSDRNVLITGAGGGIGRALCAAFAHWGARVLAVDLDAQRLDQLAAATALAARGSFDLTDYAAVQRGIAQLMQETGPVDVLVNNAGAAAATALSNLTPTGWAQDIAINLSAAYHCVEAVKAPMLERGRGVIVNIGSVNAQLALGHPAYSAAKAGLVSYTRSLALEYGPQGIRANVVAPATVRTEAWQARAARNPAIFDQLRRWYPLRQLIAAEDVANAVGFLASDLACRISGVVLPVDAGLTAGNAVMAAELTLEQF